MAGKEVRRTCTLGETLLHLSVATGTVVVVYLIAGQIGTAAVAATRYISG